MQLTSPQNPLLQKVRRAVESGRPMDGAFAAEGPHLLAEALKSEWHVEHIFCSVESMERHAQLLAAAARRGIEITEIAPRAFKSLSDTESNQGLVTLVRPKTFTWADLLHAQGPIVILDGIQDPGNAGTILRSTEAFGGAGIIFTEGSVRTSNGKLMRAAAGSLFRLPFLENLPRTEIIAEIQTRRMMFALVAGGKASLTDVHFPSSFALIVGSEGSGVSAPFLKASQTLSIQTRGVESLNAAIACSIALFEAQRRNS